MPSSNPLGGLPLNPDYHPYDQSNMPDNQLVILSSPTLGVATFLREVEESLLSMRCWDARVQAQLWSLRLATLNRAIKGGKQSNSWPQWTFFVVVIPNLGSSLKPTY